MNPKFYLMRRFAESLFGVLRSGQVVRTNRLESGLFWHDYKVVHVDDHSVILERG